MGYFRTPCNAPPFIMLRFYFIPFRLMTTYLTENGTFMGYNLNAFNGREKTIAVNG
jgi:hypothetical protein